MRAGIWVCFIFLVPACSVAPVVPPGAQVVRSVVKPGVTPPAAQGETSLVLRSFTADNREVSGAECLVDGTWFTAKATSPAQVLMPAYGANSSNISVTCDSKNLSGSVAVAPQSALSGGMGGWPALGVSVNSGGGVGVGMGWYGGSAGAGAPEVRYPEARVVLQ